MRMDFEKLTYAVIASIFIAYGIALIVIGSGDPEKRCLMVTNGDSSNYHLICEE